jgi:nucleotide-binding universal stress UspA family protein
MAVTARRPSFAIFMGCKEVAHESSSSRNENYTEEHFVRNRLLGGADAAAPLAVQIARNYGAKVYGVHVSPFDNYAPQTPDGWSAMAQLAGKETKEHTERLNDQLEGVEQEVVIGEGNIWEVISNLIERADAI